MRANARNRIDVDGYQPEKQFWRISLTDYRHIRPLRDAINEGLLGDDCMRRSYLSDFAPELLGQIESGVNYCEWHQVKKSLLHPVSTGMMRTTSRSEYVMDYTPKCINLLSGSLLPTRFRVLSFDIEVRFLAVVCVLTHTRSQDVVALRTTRRLTRSFKSPRLCATATPMRFCSTVFTRGRLAHCRYRPRPTMRASCRRTNTVQANDRCWPRGSCS